MKIRLVIAIVMLTAGLAAAQDKMAEKLRKAIVEEEANKDLNKAIEAYQAIMTEFDRERQTAATALFHLAECYRKQGKKEQAITAYQRVVREFSDQNKLAEASRNHLSKNYGLNQDLAGRPKLTPSDIQYLAAEAEARRKYKELLQAEISLIEGQIQWAEKQVKVGVMSPNGPEMVGLKRTLLELQRKLVLFDAGGPPSNR
jgi:tetratricopeptide (TPR) repeat protein